MFTRRPGRLGAAVIVVVSLVVIASLVAVATFGPASSLATVSNPMETASQPDDTEPTYTLVVADAETGDTLLELPVEDGDTVTLAYTHSVEKTPVEDVYVVDGMTLRMTEMRFQSHGAGLPSDEAVERDGEWFVADRDERHEMIRVTPGAIAGHELVLESDQHGDKAQADTQARYDLVERSNGPVTLTVRANVQTDSPSSNSNNGEKTG